MSAFEQRLLALAGHSGDAPRQVGRALHGLLGELAAARAARSDAAALDTLGMRNQRLLRLHRQHCGPRLEACARCTACAEQIEFDVPTEAVLGLPPAAADAFVEIGNARFRLPRISDLVRLEQEGANEPVPLRLARLCLIEGAPRLDAALLARLGDAFDQADPADLAAAFSEITGGKTAQVAPNLGAAMVIAEKAVNREDLICITGSFYLVADAKRFFATHPHRIGSTQNP